MHLVLFAKTIVTYLSPTAFPMFRRKYQLSWKAFLYKWVLSPRVWTRATRYLIHRIKRTTDRPERIAKGVAIGIFISFTPLFGLHVLLALIIAILLRANVFVTLISTFIGNPLTFPLIAYASIWIGNIVLTQLLGIETLSNTEATLDFALIFDNLYALLLPYVIGGSVLGLPFASGGYFLTIRAVSLYQASRRVRLLNLRSRAKKRKLHPTSLPPHPSK